MFQCAPLLSGAFDIVKQNAPNFPLPADLIVITINLQRGHFPEMPETFDIRSSLPIGLDCFLRFVSKKFL